jgi:hypothetical protein
VEYVYANMDALVLNEVSGGRVMLHRGDIWFADDPFAQARRDLFSATPIIVHSTVGRQAPAATAVPAPPKGRGRG